MRISGCVSDTPVAVRLEVTKRTAARNWTCAIIALMGRPMEPVTRLDILASGPTGYLHTKTRLPEHYVRDAPALLKEAQLLNPAVDADALFRTIWRLGCQAVRRNNERGVPVRLADLPHARPAKDEEARREGRNQATPNNSGLRPSRI
jgi:hypothetical protein